MNQDSRLHLLWTMPLYVLGVIFWFVFRGWRFLPEEDHADICWNCSHGIKCEIWDEMKRRKAERR